MNQCRFYDTRDLQLLGTVQLPASESVISMVGIGDDGRFAIVTSNARCHIVQMETEPSFLASIGTALPIREVEMLHLDQESNELLVVHHVDQIDWVDLENFSIRHRLRPSLARWRLIDRYIVTPLRTITPQTGELGDTTASMISGKSAFTITNGRGEDTETVRYKVARPLLSCAGFIVVMLTIGCVYFSRRDF